MKQGLLIILSGPSGVGKGTLRKKLMRENLLDCFYSISDTTRLRRLKEKNGLDYNFISEREFEERKQNEYYLETTEYCGSHYGTPKNQIDENLKNGKNVLLEIETDGAKKAMELYHGMYTIAVFLMPPDLEEIKRRILLRHTESEEQLKNRLDKAEAEIKEKDLYDIVLTNYSVTRTTKRFLTSIQNRMNYIDAIENGKEPPANYIIKRP